MSSDLSVVATIIAAEEPVANSSEKIALETNVEKKQMASVDEITRRILISDEGVPTANLKLDYNTFADLLGRIVDHGEKLQNSPSKGLIPCENLVVAEIEKELSGLPHVTLERVEIVEGRSNLIAKYKNFSGETKSNDHVLSYHGLHMDVVSANRDEWETDPFKLTIQGNNGDKLVCRGSTDCLGHVALYTCLIKNLAKNNIKLDFILSVVFIADEECGNDPQIGMLGLVETGKLDYMKAGPAFWIDSSDVALTVGSGTGFSFSLTAKGVSGDTQSIEKTINPVPYICELLRDITMKSNSAFPSTAREKEYKYPTSTNMKPTQTSQTNGSPNQILGHFDICGIMRLADDVAEDHAKKILHDCVEHYNQNPEKLKTWHDGFLYKLDDEKKTQVRFEFTWIDEPNLVLGEFAWKLRTIGSSGHSGILTHAINPIPFAVEIIREMARSFNFVFLSSDANADPSLTYIEPTQFGQHSSPLGQVVGPINQIQEELIVEGDVRMTPFHDPEDIKKIMGELVDSYNNFPDAISPWGPHSKCRLNDESKTQIKFELKWTRNPYHGVLCSTESLSFKLLSEATQKIYGKAELLSCNGSLPLIKELQDSGFDYQITGYGMSSGYHNSTYECCEFSQMEIGYNIQLHMLERYNQFVNGEITSDDFVDCSTKENDTVLNTSSVAQRSNHLVHFHDHDHE